MTARVRDAKDAGVDAVLHAYPAIVSALVKQAEQGSCPHAKLVFELLEPASRRRTDEEEDEDAPSLAEYLIDQLKLQPPPDFERDDARDATSTA